jgi:AcrR family transcriptional regulator
MVTKRTTRPARTTPEPRNRDATRERILSAVGTLLARDGFSSLGVNAVAREAGVDKVLIYRYFGGIEALLDAWGREALATSSATSTPEPSPHDAAGRASAALLGFARAAREHPQALEVMRWELVEDNALTRRLAGLRESAGFTDLAGLSVDESRAREVDLPAVAAVLSAGLLHLALRARTAPRWLGVPLRTRQGWARLERAAALLVRAALAGSPSDPEKEQP